MDGGACCRLLPMGSQRVGHDWATSLSLRQHKFYRLQGSNAFYSVDYKCTGQYASSLRISPYLALLLSGAHGLKQALNLHFIVHRLLVPIAQKVLQHPFFPLQTLAQLLGYLALPRSKFAEQRRGKILIQERQCKFWRKEFPLIHIKGLKRIYRRRDSKYDVLLIFVAPDLAQALNVKDCQYTLSEWTLIIQKKKKLRRATYMLISKISPFLICSGHIIILDGDKRALSSFILFSPQFNFIGEHKMINCKKQQVLFLYAWWCSS